VIDALRVFRYLRQYQRNDRATPGELAAIQRRKLEELVAYARRRSPFFARLYAGLPERGYALADLPPVTKQQMMEHFDDYCTDRRIRRAPLRRFVHDGGNVGKKYLGHVALHTSGTGGEPALIVHDARSFAHLKAMSACRGTGPSFTLRRIVRVVTRERMRVAAVLMDGGLYPSYSMFVHRSKFDRLVMDLRVLSIRTPLRELVEALNRFQPTVLVGYPTVVEALAREQMSGALDILRGRADGAVVSVSEPLLPAARRVISRAFDAPLDDQYGTGECLNVAKSCGRGAGLHVNADLAILEVVDSEGRPVPAGQFGHKVYLTNLENRVQPFIRYEIPDVVAYSDSLCPCGSPLPLLKEVSGRTDEILYVSGPHGRYDVVHPYALMVPLLHRDDVSAYQVKQVARDVLEVAVVPTAGVVPATSEIALALLESLRSSRVGADLRVAVRCVDRIEPDPKSGKTRRIWSAIGAPADVPEAAAE
jgi:phenylacetate-coenzyme A ligase PaaK-like adenylate-forming protein